MLYEVRVWEKWLKSRVKYFSYFLLFPNFWVQIFLAYSSKYYGKTESKRVNVLYLCSTFLVIVYHSKRFYTPGSAFTQLLIHWWQWLPHRVPPAHQEHKPAPCSRTFWHNNCVFCDWTRALPITETSALRPCGSDSDLFVWTYGFKMIKIIGFVVIFSHAADYRKKMQ